MVFDLLLLDGNDLTSLPLSVRRSALDELFEPGPHWQLSAQHDDGDALNAAVHEMELEGMMAKRLDSQYLPGKRTTAWRKVKRRIEQAFVVGGWAEGEGGRSGRIGGLLIGGYRDGALSYAGRVGSGLRDEEIRTLLKTFADLRRDTSPFAAGSVPAPRGPGRALGRAPRRHLGGLRRVDQRSARPPPGVSGASARRRPPHRHPPLTHPFLCYSMCVDTRRITQEAAAEGHEPVEPKPPLPRSEGGNSSTSWKVTYSTR